MARCGRGTGSRSLFGLLASDRHLAFGTMNAAALLIYLGPIEPYFELQDLHSARLRSNGVPGCTIPRGRGLAARLVTLIAVGYSTTDSAQLQLSLYLTSSRHRYSRHPRHKGAESFSSASPHFQTRGLVFWGFCSFQGLFPTTMTTTTAAT